MKFAFLKTRVSIIIVSLILGLFIGFKIANTQYRREKDVFLNSALAQASGDSAAAGQNLSPQQREQMINEVKAIIDKAKSNPQDVDAQLDAADQFIQIGRPQEAMQFLEQANKAQPNDPRIFAAMGMANFMMGKYDDAIGWAKRSLSAKPNNTGASFILIGSYIRTKTNLDEAERLIRQLETAGLDPEMIGRVREELAAVRSGKSINDAAGSGSKTMLQHGPEDQKPGAGKGGNR